MRVLALCLLGLAATAAATKFAEEEDVLVLDDDTFENALEEHETLLVEFYAPWCGHCKRLAPEYAKAAAVLKKDGFRIAKVDATANRETGEKFEVQGYPTLKFFRNGKATEYTGGRTESEIINWVRKKSGPAAKTIATANDAEDFTSEADVAVVGVFASEDDAEAKEFLKAAGANDDVAFAVSYKAAIAKKYKVKAPAVVLVKSFDEGRNDFEGDDFTADAIGSFVAANQLPLVIPFTQENAPKIFGGAIKTHILLFVDSESDEADDIVTDFKTVATEFKGRALCVTVGLDADRVLDYFGVTEDDLPTAVLVNMPEGGAMKKYMFDATVSAENIKAFANKYFDGKLKPFLKSEDIPETQDEAVHVLVGKAFDSVALDRSKDVIVEFYAPWCGHCKTLAPIYEKVAETFADIDSIVVAKMDATANEIDHPDVNVRGFPTLYFFPANTDRVIDYDGARDEDGLVEFIKEHAAVPFTLDGEEFGSADHTEL